MIFKFSFLLVVLLTTSSITSAQKVSKQIDKHLELVSNEYSGQNALSTTAYVADLWRSPGNAGFDSSIYYVKRILEDAGYQFESKHPNARLTYRLEKYPMRRPAWEPISATLNISGQLMPILDFKRNRNMVAINSFPMSSKGIEAEVVYLSECNPAAIDSLDLNGKIVFSECHPYSIFKTTVAKKGALGFLYYSIPDYNQPEKYQNAIPFTGMPFNAEYKSWCINLSYAAFTALQKELKKGSLRVKVNIDTKIYPAEELTLVAEVRGNKAPDQRFVYSAHVQEPGANDNASGVGAQAEMARVAAKLLQQKQIDPDRTLTFLWGVEIRSTNRYIQQDSLRATQIRWGMSLDMVGEDTDKTGGTFLIEKMPDPSAIWTRGDDKHTEWGAGEVSQDDFNPHYFNDYIEFVCRRHAATTNWTVNTNPFEGGSDHQPFLNATIPGLLLWHFTDVFYHTDLDRIDKVSPKTLKNVGVSALTSGLILSKDSERVSKDLLKISEQAAYLRFKKELSLSRNAIKTDKPKEDELKILNAWKKWYITALPRVTDVLTMEPSRRLKRCIKKTVKKYDKKVRKDLSNL